MDTKQIEEKLKSLSKDAEEIINDPKKRKEFIDSINKKSAIIATITEKAKDLPLLIDITKDYINGSYKVIPLKSIIAIIATIVYVVDPIDLIPDVIPVLGVTDDISAVVLCTKTVYSDLEEYKKWKQENK